MAICERDKCTACGACMNICPKNAIYFNEDEKGFLYPVINDECVECGACQRVCPRNTGSLLSIDEPVVYAAFSKDKETRMSSSSGGLFTEIAKSILNQDGFVFASRMSDDCKTVIFDSCTSEQDLSQFQGSKYVQSSIGLIFQDVKKILLNGKKVLFVGVPCQVDGLKKYLNTEYDNLFTIDIICHGVPSPKLWRDYCDKLERENHSKINNVSFRYKKPNWTRFSLKADFESGKSIINSKFNDPYLISFLKEISMRQSCYSCEYTSTRRTGDITLADFWGYRSDNFKMRNTEKGISLVLVNTEKGKVLFQMIQNKIMFQKRAMQEAMSGNKSLKQPWKKNPVSDAFWNEYIYGDGMEVAMEKYCKPYRFPLKMYLSWFLINHMYMIPKPLLQLRKKIMGGNNQSSC